MALVNRVIVSCRLENGDSLDVSTKVVGREFNVDDANKLGVKMARLFGPCVEDTLYYQVRSWSGEDGKVRRNWTKLKTQDALSDALKEVMGDASQAITG